jgi:hypothetical protein
MTGSLPTNRRHKRRFACAYSITLPLRFGARPRDPRTGAEGDTRHPLFDPLPAVTSIAFRLLDGGQADGLSLMTNSNLAELQDQGFKSLFTVSGSSFAATSSFKKMAW